MTVNYELVLEILFLRLNYKLKCGILSSECGSPVMAEEPLELAQKVSILIFVEFCGETLVECWLKTKLNKLVIHLLHC